MNLLRKVLRGVRVRLCDVSVRVLLKADVDRLPDGRSPSPFRAGGVDDLEEMASPEWEYTAPVVAHFKERLRRGDELNVAEGRFYGWTMVGEWELCFRQHAPLPPGAAFSYKVFCHPAHRGQGLSGEYFAFLKARLRQRGIRELYTVVEERNRPSVRAHQKAGFEPVGRYQVVRTLGREIPLKRKIPAHFWYRDS